MKKCRQFNLSIEIGHGKLTFAKQETGQNVWVAVCGAFQQTGHNSITELYLPIAGCCVSPTSSTNREWIGSNNYNGHEKKKLSLLLLCTRYWVNRFWSALLLMWISTTRWLKRVNLRSFHVFRKFIPKFICAGFYGYLQYCEHEIS